MDFGYMEWISDIDAGFMTVEASFEAVDAEGRIEGDLGPAGTNLTLS